VRAGGRVFDVTVTRHRLARRYLVRVTDDGRVRLTVPRGGSTAAGLQFAISQAGWIATQWTRLSAAADWHDGTPIWYRGEQCGLVVRLGRVSWADQTILASDDRTTRDAVQARLQDLAMAELPERCRQLAAQTGLQPAHIAVRNQRSRWGSCSARGAIMLNWRLLQMPSSVADYVMLHELVHLEHPDHSRRFWQGVERVCAEWRAAERWLRRHGRELL
jgi:predicted metal-dependent hydrolase